MNGRASQPAFSRVSDKAARFTESVIRDMTRLALPHHPLNSPPAFGGVADRAARFPESVTRDMTRLALQHDAVNLAQGFPDFACPQELKEAAAAAVPADINQYAITWGARDFREAIAAKTQRLYLGWSVDPQTNITVTCGATEGMIAAMLALLDPGDEVVVFEPFYENYGP